MPLPTSLQLRREAREIDETVAELPSRRAAVRDVVEALNDRILDSHRRRVDGPPVVTAEARRRRRGGPLARGAPQGLTADRASAS